MVGLLGCQTQGLRYFNKMYQTFTKYHNQVPIHTGVQIAAWTISSYFGLPKSNTTLLQMSAIEGYQQKTKGDECTHENVDRDVYFPHFKRIDGKRLAAMFKDGEAPRHEYAYSAFESIKVPGRIVFMDEVGFLMVCSKPMKSEPEQRDASCVICGGDSRLGYPVTLRGTSQSDETKAEISAKQKLKNAQVKAKKKVSGEIKDDEEKKKVVVTIPMASELHPIAPHRRITRESKLKCDRLVAIIPAPVLVCIQCRNFCEFGGSHQQFFGLYGVDLEFRKMTGSKFANPNFPTIVFAVPSSDVKSESHEIVTCTDRLLWLKDPTSPKLDHEQQQNVYEQLGLIVCGDSKALMRKRGRGWLEDSPVPVLQRATAILRVFSSVLYGLIGEVTKRFGGKDTIDFTRFKWYMRVLVNMNSLVRGLMAADKSLETHIRTMLIKWLCNESAKSTFEHFGTPLFAAHFSGLSPQCTIYIMMNNILRGMLWDRSTFFQDVEKRGPKLALGAMFSGRAKNLVNSLLFTMSLLRVINDEDVLGEKKLEGLYADLKETHATNTLFSVKSGPGVLRAMGMVPVDFDELTEMRCIINMFKTAKDNHFAVEFTEELKSQLSTSTFSAAEKRQSARQLQLKAKEKHKALHQGPVPLLNGRHARLTDGECAFCHLKTSREGLLLHIEAFTGNKRGKPEFNLREFHRKACGTPSKFYGDSLCKADGGKRHFHTFVDYKTLQPNLNLDAKMIVHSNMTKCPISICKFEAKTPHDLCLHLAYFVETFTVPKILPPYEKTKTSIKAPTTKPKDNVESKKEKKSEKLKRNPDGSEACVVCFDAPIECLCLPCGHASMCKACDSEWFGGCAICRGKIEIKLTIKLNKIPKAVIGSHIYV